MDGERNEVMTSVSSVLSMLEEQRRVAYSRSSIELVSAVENKYPLADIIMKRYVVYLVRVCVCMLHVCGGVRIMNS